ncbi:MAG TPA: alpha/beta hydrolase [Allosphingosinicella sp.]
MTRLFALLSLLALAGCSPLTAFDLVVRKDRGAGLLAADQAFAFGPRGRLDVYGPVGSQAPTRLPVIVFFYGGSWSMGKKEDYRFAGQALAAQGFLVVLPDYRLVQHARYPAFLEDGAAAVRWVRANAARLGGDPNRIVIAGHSAGAYNAAMLSFDPKWLGPDRQAVKGMIGLSGLYDFLPLDAPVTKYTFRHVEDLQSTQPVNFASTDDPPAMLLVGGRDGIVPPSNSARMAEKLSQAGVPVETRVYDSVGHVGIMSTLSTLYRAKAPVLRDMAEFARKVTAKA